MHAIALEKPPFQSWPAVRGAQFLLTGVLEPRWSCQEVVTRTAKGGMNGARDSGSMVSVVPRVEMRVSSLGWYFVGLVSSTEWRALSASFSR